VAFAQISVAAGRSSQLRIVANPTDREISLPRPQCNKYAITKESALRSTPRKPVPGIECSITGLGHKLQPEHGDRHRDSVPFRGFDDE